MSAVEPFCAVLPLRAGSEPDARAFFEEVARRRADEYRACAERTALSLESWFCVNVGARGPHLCAYLESADRVEAASGSEDPFDLWFRERMSDLLVAPWSAEDALGRAELLIRRALPRADGPLERLFAVLPLRPGGAALARAFMAEVDGDRSRDYEDCLARTGVRREAWFLHRDADGRESLATYCEASDMGFAAHGDEHPFDRWFRERLSGTTATEFSANNELSRSRELMTFSDGRLALA